MTPPHATTSGTAVSDLPPHLLQFNVLKRIDGRSLASLSSASRNWRSLCSEESLWRGICTSTWPSVAGESLSALDSGYRSLYYDCITVPCPTLKPRCRNRNTAAYPSIERLISAVDIYCDDQALWSTDLSTETLSDEFLSSPFKLQILSPKEKIPTPLRFDDEAEECVDTVEARLRVSWILIDPSQRRAFSVTGLKPVEANRHWLNGFIKLRYATVVPGPAGEMAQCSVVVTCGGSHGGEMEVVDVSLQVEDLNLRPLSGTESLIAVQEAMAARRRRFSGGQTEKERYREFLKRRVEKKEMEEMIKRNMDILIVSAVVSLFVAIFAFFRSTS